MLALVAVSESRCGESGRARKGPDRSGGCLRRRLTTAGQGSGRHLHLSPKVLRYPQLDFGPGRRADE